MLSEGDQVLGNLGWREYWKSSGEGIQKLGKLAPDGIDVYFDNVGGEHLEAAIDQMNDFDLGKSLVRIA